MRNIVRFVGLVLMLCGPGIANAAAQDADVSYLVTNGGVDAKGNGEVHFYPHGHHDGALVDWSRSGGSVHIPAGSYDVHVTFSDGAAAKDLWFDNQSFSGKVAKTVEMALPITEVSVLITNGGIDTHDNGEAHFFVHGHRDGAVVDWCRSGGSVRFPPEATMSM